MNSNSALPMDPNLAVSIRNAYKRYGSGPYVLKNLSMDIPKNQIYGLLGSSGCGKTTLLRTLVGAIDLDYGSIEVLETSKKKLGFMPQETSLFGEFTIAEQFHFYASLYKIPKDTFRAKIKELTEVLDLPRDDQICETLSGGQVRRVSIAVTLLHSPTLVILDEPTSGLDPVLANIFWKHLNQLSVQGQTIIITTHYIEEARQANKVGLMRHGVLLAEDAPENLIEEYKVESLEDVFLCLCNEQNARTVIEPEGKIPFKPLYQNDPSHYSMFWPHTKAIVYKNIKWIQRNWIMFCSLSFLLSVSCIIESNECLKYYPPMRVGVLNYGPNDCERYKMGQFNCSEEQDVDFSCDFIEAWRHEKPDMPLIEYDDFKAAMRDGKSRKLVTILEIPSNFTSGALSRFQDGWTADRELLASASIDVRIDTTDFMAVFKMEQDIRDVLDVMFKNYLKICGYNPTVANIPPMNINTQEFFGKNVVYKRYDYTTHIAMACVCGITYIAPLILLTISLCMEKMMGSYTRCLVGGVKIIEIFSGYMIVLTVFNAINIGLMTFFQFVIYDKPYGTFWVAYLLVNVLGFTGNLFGFFIVVLTRSLTESAGIVIVSSLALYTFTGFMWPIEAANLAIIKPISMLVFPNTLVLKSVLAVIFKDASLFQKQVLQGFGICIVHCIGYVALTYVIIKIRKGM